MSKSYIKLKNVGEDATFTVARCEPGTGTYPDVEFEDDHGRVYPVPKSAADRQLERLGLTMGDVVGQAIRISRGENKKTPTRPFWNIDLLGVEQRGAKGNGSGPASAGKAGASTSGGGVATPLPPQPPAPSPAPAEREKDSALYLRMARFALHDVKKVYDEAGLVLTADAAAAITATLYIQAKR